MPGGALRTPSLRDSTDPLLPKGYTLFTILRYFAVADWPLNFYKGTFDANILFLRQKRAPENPIYLYKFFKKNQKKGFCGLFLKKLLVTSRHLELTLESKKNLLSDNPRYATGLNRDVWVKFKYCNSFLSKQAEWSNCVSIEMS